MEVTGTRDMPKKAAPKLVYHQTLNLDQHTFDLMHKWSEERRCNVSALMRQLIIEHAAKQQQTEHVS
jgi:hypothetical protein